MAEKARKTARLSAARRRKARKKQERKSGHERCKGSRRSRRRASRALVSGASAITCAHVPRTAALPTTARQPVVDHRQAIPAPERFIVDEEPGRTEDAAADRFLGTRLG